MSEEERKLAGLACSKERMTLLDDAVLAIQLRLREEELEEAA